MSELEDPEHVLSATFDAVVDHPHGAERGPVGVALDEALAWAGARAAIVYVTSGGVRYTAGERADDLCPPLPAVDSFSQSRRDPRFAFLDRAEDDEPVAWQVRGWTTTLGDGYARAFVEALRSDPRISDVQAADGQAAARFRIMAATHGEAQATSEQVVDDARRAAGRLAGPRKRVSVFSGADVILPAVEEAIPNWVVTALMESRRGALGSYAETLTETIWGDPRVHNFDEAGVVADKRSSRLIAKFEVVADSELAAMNLGTEIVDRAVLEANEYADDPPPDLRIQISVTRL